MDRKSMQGNAAAIAAATQQISVKGPSELERLNENLSRIATLIDQAEMRLQSVTSPSPAISAVDAEPGFIHISGLADKAHQAAGRLQALIDGLVI